MKVTTLITCLSLCVMPAYGLSYNDTNQTAQSNVVIEQHFTQGQLAQMLAPIALYPDALLTHILIAASYPLEVVEAYRWQQQNQSLSEQAFKQALAKQNWDESVKALVPFEKVLSKMHDELSWMRDIGDAFLAQESEVLETIQTLRQQAYTAGSLDDMENTRVEYDNEKIVIINNQPEVIYVPYYDTRVVYGHWRWHHYPPRYWHIGHHYYHHPIAWHSGVHISLGFHFSAFHWHHGYVVVNHHGAHHHRKRHHIIHSGYTKRWHHNAHHRKNVAYRTAVTKDKYRKHHGHSVRYSKQRNTAKLVRTSKQVAEHRTYKKLSTSQYNKAKPHNTRQNYRAGKKSHEQGNKASTKETRLYRNNKKREQAVESYHRKSTDRQFTSQKSQNKTTPQNRTTSQNKTTQGLTRQSKKSASTQSASHNKVRSSSINASGKAKSHRSERKH